MAEPDKRRSMIEQLLGKGALTREKIPTLALAIMLCAILFPTIRFSLSMKDPSAAELLTAICIAVFASIIFLWILDATGILMFRSSWISKAVWGTAIVSILGTSVGVYKNFFADRKYVLEGQWKLSVSQGTLGRILDNRNVLMIYSDSSGAYWGYSEAKPIHSNQTTQPFVDENHADVANWAEVDDLDDKAGKAVLRIQLPTGTEVISIDNLAVSANKKRIEGSSGTHQTIGEYKITLTRPK